MRANRGADTAPEVAIRQELHRRGLRFRKNFRIDLAPGRRVRPDIVFSRLRFAVFIDGCFWHGCPEHGETPAANADFWRTKINSTRNRDAMHNQWLDEAGWSSLRIWEHEPLELAVEHVMQIASVLRETVGPP
jgi:DNA mismatch endonuclease (patch repair protein)